MNNEQTSVGGVSTLGLLGVAFIVLKLVGVIAWSWWWVLAPFWIPWLVFAIIVALVVILVPLFDKR